MSASGTAQNSYAFPRPLFSRQTAILVTLAMTALYAFWDFTLPGEFTVAIFYGSSVVASGWARSSRFLWLTTLLTVALTYAGLASGPQPPDGLLTAFYVNRSFVAVGLVVVAAIVHQRMQMRDRMEHVHDIELWQNERLQEAHEELRRVNEQLEERVRQEVSRRIETERSLHQAQKMEAIGQLAGGIAHDFNNMLTAIMANVDMIRARCAENDPCRRFAENALLGAKQAARFTRQLLGFARRRQMEPEFVDIAAALNDVLSLARHVLPPSIELSAQTSADVRNAYVDAAQLESALLNLVINSRDAMPDGGRITMAAHNLTAAADAVDLPPGEYVRVSVIDTGTGMSPEVMARAFEPLLTTKAAGKGTGLGLSMVHSFATQSGGVARIESVPNRGTTVHIYLPRPRDPTSPS
jgi:signal transduction histidine kinase